MVRVWQILYAIRKPTDAIGIFALNAEEYLTSSNAVDSLAEAYRVSGDVRVAREIYQEALKLDPTNERHGLL